MYGVPYRLNTKQDWLNAAEYVNQNGGKAELVSRLRELRDRSKIKVLKPGITKPAEEQTAEDYQDVDDPGCEKIHLGFTDAEINRLLQTLEEK
jgi:hypothetical protein